MPLPDGMIFYLVVLLLALWAIGLSFGAGGDMVHLLLLFSAVLLLAEFVQRARATA